MRKELLVSILILCSAAAFAQPSRQTMAVLGDSYSTFEGYIPEGYAIWYYNAGRDGNDVSAVEQTWWWQVAESLDMDIVLNSSYSGSTICHTGYDGKDYKDRSFVTRAQDVIEAAPDVLFIFGGTNDSWADSPLGEVKYAGRTEEDLYCFLPAFCQLLETLTKALPRTRIVNICNTELKPEIAGGENVISYHYGVDCVQLYNIDKQSGHPSVTGMSQIASQVLEKFRGR